ncbi:MAG: hypothetical protein LBH11_03420 [Propionibacteriaceae bacterium]|jgi:hypothetical protein|nr:hypothetical protein [Propionibacteriaceae bacterium]
MSETPDARLCVALAYCERDPLSYVDITETLRRGGGEVVAAGRDGVLVRCNTRSLLYLAADSGEAANLLLAGVEPPEVMVVHGDEAADVACQRFGLAATPRCWQVALVSGKLPEPPRADLVFRTLGAEYTHEVAIRYTLQFSEERIRENLDAGLIIGGFLIDEPDKMIGFIGTHEDGSMGFLEVYPEFRRGDVGTCMTIELARRHLAHGWTPYGHIIEGNLASLNMSQGLGFSKAEGTLRWLVPSKPDQSR